MFEWFWENFEKIEKLKTAIAPVLAMIVPVSAMECPTCGYVIELNLGVLNMNHFRVISFVTVTGVLLKYSFSRILQTIFGRGDCFWMESEDFQPRPTK